MGTACQWPAVCGDETSALKATGHAPPFKPLHSQDTCTDNAAAAAASIGGAQLTVGEPVGLPTETFPHDEEQADGDLLDLLLECPQD
jgi:hypothetical protein